MNLLDLILKPAPHPYEKELEARLKLRRERREITRALREGRA